MICFLFRTSLIRPTQSLHWVLLQEEHNVRQHISAFSPENFWRHEGACLPLGAAEALEHFK